MIISDYFHYLSKIGENNIYLELWGLIRINEF